MFPNPPVMCGKGFYVQVPQTGPVVSMRLWYTEHPLKLVLLSLLCLQVVCRFTGTKLPLFLFDCKKMFRIKFVQVNMCLKMLSQDSWCLYSQLLIIFEGWVMVGFKPNNNNKPIKFTGSMGKALQRRFVHVTSAKSWRNAREKPRGAAGAPIIPVASDWSWTKCLQPVWTPTILSKTKNLTPRTAKTTLRHYWQNWTKSRRSEQWSRPRRRSRGGRKRRGSGWRISWAVIPCWRIIPRVPGRWIIRWRGGGMMMLCLRIAHVLSQRRRVMCLLMIRCVQIFIGSSWRSMLNDF